MAFTSRSGEKFSNLSRAKAADRRFGAVPIQGKSIGDGKQPIPQSKFSTLEPARKPTASPVKDAAATDDDQLSQAAAEHGTALTLNIKHGEDGRHHVSARMGDGSSHESDYSSAEDAHAAARTLAGVNQGPQDDDQELPDFSRAM